MNAIEAGARLELQQLTLTYAEAIDAKDFRSVADLFTEDAVFRAYDRPQGEARGREQIANLVEKLVSSFAATMHHVSGPRIEFVGSNRAAGVVPLQAWHSFAEDRPDAILWGRYLDQYFRGPDGWQFTNRTLTVHGHQDFQFPWISPA